MATLLDYEPFAHVLRGLGAKLYHAPALHENLIKAWSEPQRHYHTPQHLEECLLHLEQERWGGLLNAPDRNVLALALWFHDSIYDIKGTENELHSAKWAQQSLNLLDISSAHIETINTLILSTRHGVPSENHRLVPWMLDIDLSILGSTPSRFAHYTQQVRQEYSWVDDLNYRRGRSVVMTRFLALSNLPMYKTEAGQIDYEDQARKNIMAHLAGIERFELAMPTIKEFLCNDLSI